MKVSRGDRDNLRNVANPSDANNHKDDNFVPWQSTLRLKFL